MLRRSQSRTRLVSLAFRDVAALFAVVVMASLAMPGEVLAQGCAMCGTAVGDADDPLAQSLSASILFMVSMPFLVFFSVTGWIVYRVRQTRQTELMSDELEENAR